MSLSGDLPITVIWALSWLPSHLSQPKRDQKLINMISLKKRDLGINGMNELSWIYLLLTFLLGQAPRDVKPTVDKGGVHRSYILRNSLWTFPFKSSLRKVIVYVPLAWCPPILWSCLSACSTFVYRCILCLHLCVRPCCIQMPSL